MATQIDTPSGNNRFFRFTDDSGQSDMLKPRCPTLKVVSVTLESTSREQKGQGHMGR